MPDAQGAGFWLVAALRETGENGAAAALAASLDASALQTSLGGTGWQSRLDVLRAPIPPGDSSGGGVPIRTGVCPHRPLSLRF